MSEMKTPYLKRPLSKLVEEPNLQYEQCGKRIVLVTIDGTPLTAYLKAQEVPTGSPLIMVEASQVRALLDEITEARMIMASLAA